MFEPLVTQRFAPIVVFGFDVVNPTSQSDNTGSFSFEQDLIHVLGIVDHDGRMYKLHILDPVNFALDKSILKADEVTSFDTAPRFKYDLQTDVVEIY